MMIDPAIQKFADETNGSVTPEMVIEAGGTVDKNGELVLPAEALDALRWMVLEQQSLRQSDTD